MNKLYKGNFLFILGFSIVFIMVLLFSSVALTKRNKTAFDSEGYILSSSKKISFASGTQYRFNFDNKENANGIVNKETIRREIYSATEEENVSNRLDLQKRVNKYNAIDGLTASMVEDTSYLVFLFEVDYSKSIDLKNINEDYVFGSGTDSNIIKFKMEAEGFACNG